MAYASRAGRAKVSSTNPQAQAVCDRCGIWYNLADLQWQFEWNATTLYNKRLLFCSHCLDVPQEQLRTIVLPPDPLPVLNARTENFAADEAGPTTAYIAQPAAKGDTTIFVTSVTGFSVDQNVLVQMNNAAFAEVMILTLDPVHNSIGINIPLPYAASGSGAIVTAALT